MIKSKLYFVLLIVILLLSGCTSDTQNNSNRIVENNSDSNSIIQPTISVDVPESISFDFDDEYTLEEIPASQLQIGVPAGICIYNDNLVVCDKNNSCLVLLDKECDFIKTIGVLGMGPLEFTEPTGITVHGGNLYVLDNGNRRIQILDSNYNFVDEISLDTLIHEQGYSEYIDLAVDDNNIIYISTFASTLIDGHIFRIEDKKSDKLAKQFIGHLFCYDGMVYATDSRELIEEGDMQSAICGNNSLYRIEDEDLIKINDLPFKYMPEGICIYNDKLYTISGLWGCLDIFSLNGELEVPVIEVPNISEDRYLAVYNENLIYCTDMGGPSILKITKTKSE